MKDPFSCDEPALQARAGIVGRAAARRAVASRAVGTADLNVLLDILGLLPEDDPREEGRQCPSGFWRRGEGARCSSVEW
ncbi:hypothetical protein ACFYYB_26290 [Streptomyces sp. NPDC002886]|uniref:hypothetical protein n=1 Tax=Streptomyces sp. NPDC002886 TaxID=3364667 RepID=UPI0036A257AE